MAKIEPCWINKLEKDYKLCHVSTLISATIEHSHFKGLSADDEAYISKINGKYNQFSKLIRRSSEFITLNLEML